MADRMGEGNSYTLTEPDAHGTFTLVAVGADRMTAVDAALAGIVAASRVGQDTPASEAAIALPVRAERPDLPTLIEALADALTGQATEHHAAIDTARLDGLLRTDDGLTAWGYAFVEPNVQHASRLPAVTSVEVENDGGQTTITLTLAGATDDR